MKKNLILLAMFIINLGLSTIAISGEAIGYVKTLQGDASILRAGTVSKITVGSGIEVGDLIRTEANGAVGFTLVDSTVLSLGKSTTFVIDAYLFEPSKGDLKLGSKISSGTMQYISGKIAKLKPEAVTVRTPTGTIGVRGTRFVVSI